MHRLFQRSAGFYRKHSSVVIAFGLALLFFLVQLSFINDYGVTWDEPLHRNWGKLFFYFLKTGDRHFLDLMPGHGIHYGPVYYLANFLLSEQLYQTGLLSFVASNHVLNLMTAGLAVFFVFLLAESFRGRRIAFLSVLLFVAFPQFLAHAHYNPKDIPLLVSVLAAVTMFERALQSGKRPLFCLSGLLLGMSIALKINALLMMPAFVAAYATYAISQRSSLALKEVFKTVLLVTLCVIIGLLALWPSAWGDLALIPQSVSFFLHDFWPGRVLYFGAEYTGGELPWYYTSLEYLMSMPVLMISSFLCGLWIAVRLLSQNFSKRPFLLFLLTWIFFPLLVSMKPQLVRYDGMRQFFFCLPAIAIVAALGVDAVLAWIEKRSARPALVCTVALVLVVGSLLYEVWTLHPFQGSYRNEVVRLAYPRDMDRELQIEFWGPTYLQGMQWLIDNAEPNPVICVPTAGVLVTWYPWRDDFTFECSAKSNYIMFFTRYSEVGQYALQTLPPVFMIERMGATLLKIYKVK